MHKHSLFWFVLYKKDTLLLRFNTQGMLVQKHGKPEKYLNLVIDDKFRTNFVSFVYILATWILIHLEKIKSDESMKGKHVHVQTYVN